MIGNSLVDLNPDFHGTDYHSYITRDGGHTWLRVPYIDGQVSWAFGGHGSVIAGVNILSNLPALIVYSFDQGKTWQNCTMPDVLLFALTLTLPLPNPNPSPNPNSNTTRSLNLTVTRTLTFLLLC